MKRLSILQNELSSCTKTELLDILSDWILDEDCSDDTIDHIDTCLAELERRFPVTPTMTAKESLQDFHRKHPELFEVR